MFERAIADDGSLQSVSSYRTTRKFACRANKLVLIFELFTWERRMDNYRQQPNAMDGRHRRDLPDYVQTVVVKGKINSYSIPPRFLPSLTY